MERRPVGGIRRVPRVGNSFPSVMFNIPGTPAGAVTCFDGYPMMLRGEPVSRSAPVFNRPSSDNSFTMRDSFRQGQEEQ